MLTRCVDCNKVVEISELTNHHLNECEFKQFYKEHGLCKLHILKAEAHKHLCTKPKPAGAVKCPICYENVFPNTNIGWRKHLLVDKCGKNPRKVII
jgi:centrosomal protein CEP104